MGTRVGIGLQQRQRHRYSAVHGFWPLEELAELENGPNEWVFICLVLQSDEVKCT